MINYGKMEYRRSIMIGVNENEKQSVVRETVGIFPDDSTLMAAIDELEQQHFARQDISVVTNAAEVQKAYQSAFKRPSNLVGDARAPRSFLVMPEEQSLAQAVFVGAGALFGVVCAMSIVISAGIHYENVTALFMVGTILGGLVGLAAAIAQTTIRRKHLQRQMNNGGLLLWVNTPTRERERVASGILSRNGARDVRIQQVVLG